MTGLALALSATHGGRSRSTSESEGNGNGNGHHHHHHHHHRHHNHTHHIHSKKATKQHSITEVVTNNTILSNTALGNCIQNLMGNNNLDIIIAQELQSTDMIDGGVLSMQKPNELNVIDSSVTSNKNQNKLSPSTSSNSISGAASGSLSNVGGGASGTASTTSSATLITTNTAAANGGQLQVPNDRISRATSPSQSHASSSSNGDTNRLELCFLSGSLFLFSFYLQ